MQCKYDIFASPCLILVECSQHQMLIIFTASTRPGPWSRLVGVSMKPVQGGITDCSPEPSSGFTRH